MLKTTQDILSFPFISVFKMPSGEEFVCKVVGDNTSDWVVEKPLCMVSTEKGLQFAPFLLMANMNEHMHIPKPALMARPDPKLEEQYKSALSPIALPKKSGIIV